MPPTDSGLGSSSDDTLDLQLPPEFSALFAEGHGRPASLDVPAAGPLLDNLAGWGAADTPAGPFELVPVRPARDLALITGWMNDPAVAAFWELAGPPETTAAHLRGQLDGDGRSVPCLGVLAGVPMSYWEIYRADLDPSPATTRPAPRTPVSICSSAGAETGDAGWAACCCAPPPISYSTTARSARGSSPSPICATPPPSRPS